MFVTLYLLNLRNKERKNLESEFFTTRQLTQLLFSWHSISILATEQWLHNKAGINKPFDLTTDLWFRFFTVYKVAITWVVFSSWTQMLIETKLELRSSLILKVQCGSRVSDLAIIWLHFVSIQQIYNIEKCEACQLASLLVIGEIESTKSVSICILFLLMLMYVF